MKYLAVVNFTAPPLLFCKIVCTDPLPKLCCPIITARLWSCSAPATISDAEAEPPFTNTTIGAPFNTSSGVALKLILECSIRPSVYTINPSVKKASLTDTAAFNKPPGLFRKSNTKPFNSALSVSFLSAEIASSKLAPVRV